MKSLRAVCVVTIMATVMPFGLGSQGFVHAQSERRGNEKRENEKRRPAADSATATPESVGFSSERLENLHKLIQDEIEQKQLAGAITILARHGKIVDYRMYGERDLDSRAPMTKDTIFRDYSLTKPVTGVAMMILFEQGKWLSNQPIATYIPEFKDLKVFNGVDRQGKPILGLNQNIRRQCAS